MGVSSVRQTVISSGRSLEAQFISNGLSRKTQIATPVTNYCNNRVETYRPPKKPHSESMHPRLFQIEFVLEFVQQFIGDLAPMTELQ